MGGPFQFEGLKMTNQKTIADDAARPPQPVSWAETSDDVILRVRRAALADAHSLAPRLRKADAQAVIAAGAATPLSSLLSGLGEAADAFTVADGDDTPMMMFGAVPHPFDHETGLVWALACAQIDDHRRLLLSEAPKWIEAFHQKYPRLANFLDARNTSYQRWLSRVGFTFSEPVPGFGPGRLPFLPFERDGFACDWCSSNGGPIRR